MTLANFAHLDSNHLSQSVFVHFNLKLDNRACALIESGIAELVDDLKAQSVRYFDEIINHRWNAVMFTRPFDGDSQIMHYIVVDAPAFAGEGDGSKRRVEQFVDGVVKRFVSRFISRL